MNICIYMHINIYIHIYIYIYIYVGRKGEPLTDDTPSVKWDGLAGFNVLTLTYTYTDVIPL